MRRRSLWMANLACLELHPHPVRADDLDHPDELRVDLDPVPGVEWAQVREVAHVVHATLTDLGLVGWPKTSGSRGMHIYVRIEQRWTFDEVRRAALALAREVERRAPALATSKWWKEERHGVFLDYNQNAKDRTIAAAYSVRPRPDARVSAPLTWDEIDACDPGGLHARHDAGALRGDRRSAMPPWTGIHARWTRCSSCRRGTSATGSAMRRGRRTTGSRRASRRACSRHAARTPKRPLIEIGRAQRKEDALAGLERGRRVTRKRRRISQPADVLVDAMRGRFSDLDAHPRQPRARPRRAAARAGGAGSGRSPISQRDAPKHLLELVRRS